MFCWYCPGISSNARDPLQLSCWVVHKKFIWKFQHLIIFFFTTSPAQHELFVDSNRFRDTLILISQKNFVIQPLTGVSFVVDTLQALCMWMRTRFYLQASYSGPGFAQTAQRRHCMRSSYWSNRLKGLCHGHKYLHLFSDSEAYHEQMGPKPISNGNLDVALSNEHT